MERVLLPMEPVEPRMASFFTRFIFAEMAGRGYAGGSPKNLVDKVQGACLIS